METSAREGEGLSVPARSKNEMSFFFLPIKKEMKAIRSSPGAADGSELAPVLPLPPLCFLPLF